MNQKKKPTTAHIVSATNANGLTLYGLENDKGKPLTPKMFSHISPLSNNLFLVQLNDKKNIFRPNGTAVLNEWFDHISDLWQDGCFIYGNTSRTTKSSSAHLLQGIAHISGIYLFPMIFSNVHRLTNAQSPTFDFHASLNDKPLILCSHGGIYNPDKSHLPTSKSIDLKLFFEKTINWIFPGLQLFYRDTNAPIIAEDIYHVGSIIRAGFFIDATTKLLKPIHKTRFLIASAHAAMFCDVTDKSNNAKRWGQAVFHFNSFFKVLDVYKLGNVTQVFLLHIPPAVASYFADNELIINMLNHSSVNIPSLVDLARNSLDSKMSQHVHPRSNDKDFVERMAFPIGLDNNFQLMPLSPAPEPKDEQLAELSNIIHLLANDNDIQDFFQK